MKEKILITVKTYPTLSSKYAELVCTAGVNDAGEWRRLYPIRFRQLYDEQKYQKYQWVEAKLEPSKIDNRPESFKIIEDSLQVIGEPLSTKNMWVQRRDAFINKVSIYKDLTVLIAQAHQNKLSLAAFKPSRFLDFICKPVEREWDSQKLKELEDQKKQLHLFDDAETVAQQFEVVNKLPYKFSYKFEDNKGRSSTLMIEDWEIGALYWNCLRNSFGDEKVAVQKVREKFWERFVASNKHDLTLILGTTLEFHRKKALNPFVIIGVFYPPKDIQGRLF